MQNKRIKKVIATVITLMSVCALAAGCGKKETGNTQETTDTQTTIGASEEVDKEHKDEVEERVVVSSVSAVQILDELGVPMIGVPTSSYELPESVANATKIGSAMEPDLEIIASLEPTVVVSVDSLSEDLKTQFDTLNIESQFMNLSSFDGMIESIQNMGKRFDQEAKADELVKILEEKEKKVVDSVSEKESPSILIIFGAGQSFMVASETSYVGDLAKSIGAKNVLTDAQGSFVPVDMEYLADKNPDYILLMAHANPEESLNALKEEFSSNAAWKNFDAVKEDKVYALDTEYFGMSANLLAADAMEKLADLIYAK